MIIDAFDEVVSYLPHRLKCVLSGLPREIRVNVYELRIRAGKPLIIYGGFGLRFVKTDKTTGVFYSDDCLIPESCEISQIITSLCNYSVYTHQNDIAKGFLTFGNGHRAGVCGTAVPDKERISTIRDIDSLNIRIATYIDVELPDVVCDIKNNTVSGIVVCGPPCSGKTTLLRNIASKCSSLYSCGYVKTVVIDERFELGHSAGLNCDVLRGFSKYDGIIYATRVLAPELIICDEICDEREAKEIIKCCNSGIKFIVSIHAESVGALLHRSVGKLLTECGFFNYVLFLDNINMCKDMEIFKTEEILNEPDSCSYGNVQLCHNSISDNKKRDCSLQNVVRINKSD